MNDRNNMYDSLRQKMEETGFQFIREQKPHHQSRKENELIFTHPQLVNKLEKSGFKVKAKNFYIKPLSDEPDCEIGFVTGRSSPLFEASHFSKPNSIDTFGDTPAWTNREGDYSIDQLLKSIKSYLRNSLIKDFSDSYLFTWNPTKSEWNDIQEQIDHIVLRGSVEIRRSCGSNKSIKKGDRVFVMRLGKEPKGIMASGYAKSAYFVAPHWDGTEGKTANYVRIELDVLINPEANDLFGSDYLSQVDPDKIQVWYPQQSGISIKSEVVDALESSWFDFITKNKYVSESFYTDEVIGDESKTFLEGKSRDVVQTRYERSPRARKLCLEHHGYSCQICEFNFETHFGDIGKGFIHVHHINPVSENQGGFHTDPKTDLIPVCPNCHAMIHSKRPALSVQVIRDIWRAEQ